MGYILSQEMLSMSVLAMSGKKLPQFWKCGGPDKYNWAFGWWTGLDDDLLCVVPDVQDDFLAGVLFLSPVCSSRILAILAFGAKRFLLAMDGNMN